MEFIALQNMQTILSEWRWKYNNRFPIFQAVEIYLVSQTRAAKTQAFIVILAKFSTNPKWKHKFE